MCCRLAASCCWFITAMSSPISAGWTFSVAPLNISATVSRSVASAVNSLRRSHNMYALSLAVCCVSVPWPPCPAAGGSVPRYWAPDAWPLVPIYMWACELTVSGCFCFGVVPPTAPSSCNSRLVPSVLFGCDCDSAPVTRRLIASQLFLRSVHRTLSRSSSCFSCLSKLSCSLSRSSLVRLFISNSDCYALSVYYSLFYYYSIFIRLTFSIVGIHSLAPPVLIHEDCETARWCTYRPVVNVGRRVSRGMGRSPERVNRYVGTSVTSLTIRWLFANRPYYYNYSLLFLR